MLGLFRSGRICDLLVRLLTSMAAISGIYQLVTWGVEILLGKLVVGGITQTKTKTDIPTWNTHLKSRITSCTIVFQKNKYVNLACFLNICKHIMVFLCFSTVNKK